MKGKGLHIICAAMICIATMAISACDGEDLNGLRGKDVLSFVTLNRNIKEGSRAAYTGVFGATVFHANTLDELNNLTQKDQSKIHDGIDNAAISERNGVWSTDQEKYWPSGGGILVVAYSPYSNIGTDRVREPYNMHSPYIYGNWQNNQTDLLFADVRWLEVATSSNSPVPVTFNHALAKVSVNIRVASSGLGEESWKMTLTGVEMMRVRNQGSVTINNNGSNGWSTNNNGAWNVDDKEFETDMKYSGRVLLTTTPLGVLQNKIVMPQHLLVKENASHQALKITYDLETTHKYIDHNGKEIVQVVTDKNLVKEIPLKTANITKWEMGRHITYNVVFNFSKPIEFEGSTNPWTDVPNIEL